MHLLMLQSCQHSYSEVRKSDGTDEQPPERCFTLLAMDLASIKTAYGDQLDYQVMYGTKPPNLMAIIQRNTA